MRYCNVQMDQQDASPLQRTLNARKSRPTVWENPVAMETYTWTGGRSSALHPISCQQLDRTQLGERRNHQAALPRHVRRLPFLRPVAVNGGVECRPTNGLLNEVRNEVLGRCRGARQKPLRLCFQPGQLFFEKLADPINRSHVSKRIGKRDRRTATALGGRPPRRAGGVKSQGENPRHRTATQSKRHL